MASGGETGEWPARERRRRDQSLRRDSIAKQLTRPKNLTLSATGCCHLFRQVVTAFRVLITSVFSIDCCATFLRLLWMLSTPVRSSHKMAKSAYIGAISSARHLPGADMTCRYLTRNLSRESARIEHTSDHRRMVPGKVSTLPFRDASRRSLTQWELLVSRRLLGTNRGITETATVTVSGRGPKRAGDTTASRVSVCRERAAVRSVTGAIVAFSCGTGRHAAISTEIIR